MKMKSMPRILRNKTSKGFTIVELLVVISVMAILAMFFVNNSTTNLKKGRDARRKSDLELIRSGIETYKADCGSYPASGAISYGNSLKGSGATANCSNANTYITKVPQDPQNNAGKTYSYTLAGGVYTICASLEAVAGAVPGGCGSCGSSACNYSVTSP